jgi:hypothetical protein
MSYKDFSVSYNSAKWRALLKGEKEALVKKKPEEIYDFFHPKRKFYAYCMLFVICLVSTSGYFMYVTIICSIIFFS